MSGLANSLYPKCVYLKCTVHSKVSGGKHSCTDRTGKTWQDSVSVDLSLMGVDPRDAEHSQMQKDNLEKGEHGRAWKQLPLYNNDK